MKIFLFVDATSTKIQTRVACKLDKEMFFMVDSVHVGDMPWLRRNFGDIPHRLYSYLGNSDDDSHRWEDWNISQVNGGYFFFPTFLVCFDVNEKISDEEWTMMDYYFLKHLGIVETFDGTEVDWCGAEFLLDQCSKKLLQGPDVTSYDSCFMDEEQRPDGTSYEFDYQVNGVWDYCLAEIKKPYTDRPYTVVLRKFSENGFKKLFTSLFICSSWGFAQSDRDFSAKLWEQLDMEGEYDLDAMLKAHTDSCHPGKGNVPECEPEVYRLTIEETNEQLRKKREKSFDVIMEQ